VPAGLETVEAGLSYDDRPIRMNVQHAMLNRIRHLHYDQQEV
jgi:hypothetical protein